MISRLAERIAIVFKFSADIEHPFNPNIDLHNEKKPSNEALETRCENASIAKFLSADGG